MLRLLASLLTVLALACSQAETPAADTTAEPAANAMAEVPTESEPEPVDAAREALRIRASAIFGGMPDEVSNEANPVTEEKVSLGRMLYYEKRLSKNHDIACNSCHQLDAFGVDGEATSPGHRGQRGDRNSPTVYNAALHITQFWDGRAPDVEAQAKGPVLNPIEMAMRDEASVVAVLNSIPDYPPLFAEAFPDDAEPLTYDNMARAIGAFERRLTTPSRFDAFLEGQIDALSDDEAAGLETFFAVGCIQCHVGPAIGGGSYQKLGRNLPYPTEDPGRAGVTGDEADRGFFKVPSLRNIEQTGPYFHDGSIASLDEAVRLMGRHQLGIELTDPQQTEILAFLASLTGQVDEAYIQQPQLPERGLDTPAPDPR
ncbi:MAG: c-type cytochrome [Deltaproteobacteria bacterium]|nr:c-type cytochrome [Deltaproteobacteria bacterium]MBW2360962.1 c-type cytochrome [Deltaproteobacteria bacterium]